MKRVLIIGGYGNFGACAARRLSAENDIRVIVAGRDLAKAQAFARELGNDAEGATLDINLGIGAAFATIKPDIVIHTSGPFQGQGYDVAKACIDFGCHYIDLADARSFVRDIGVLDDAARLKDVCVIAGASSVPTLATCVIDDNLQHFSEINGVDYTIATAQKTSSGLATVTAVLGYAGKAFLALRQGSMEKIYGWLDLRFRKYPELGWRMLGNCDIPDLDLLPQRYPSLRDIRFQAALELPFLHLGVWLMAWMVRLRLLPSVAAFAKPLRAASGLFDFIGGEKSAFQMTLAGKDHAARFLERTFYIVARQGHGLYIPVTPAVLCALKLARGEMTWRGARPCMGLLTLDEYQQGLSGLDISFIK